MSLKEFFSSLFAKNESQQVWINKILDTQQDGKSQDTKKEAQNALVSLLKSSKRYKVTVEQWVDIIQRHPTQVDAIFAAFGSSKRFFGLMADKRHLGYQFTKSQAWENLLNQFGDQTDTHSQLVLHSLKDKMLQFAPESLENWEKAKKAEIKKELAGLQKQQEEQQGERQKQQEQAEQQAELKLDAELKYLRNKNKAYNTAKVLANDPTEYRVVQQRIQSLDLAQKPKTLHQPSFMVQKVERSWLSLPKSVATKVDRLLNGWLRKEKYQAGIEKLANENPSIDYSKTAERLNHLDLVGVQNSEFKVKSSLAYLDLSADSIKSNPVAKLELSSPVRAKLTNLAQTPVKNSAQNSLNIAGTPLSKNSSETLLPLKRVEASVSIPDDATVYSGLSDFENIDSEDFALLHSPDDDFVEAELDPVFDREILEYMQGKYADEDNSQAECGFNTPKKRGNSLKSSAESSPLQDLERVYDTPMTDDSSIDMQRVPASPINDETNQLLLTPEPKLIQDSSYTFTTLRSLKRVYAETDTPESDLSELARAVNTPESDLPKLARAVNTPESDLSELARAVNTPGSDLSELARAVNTPESNTSNSYRYFKSASSCRVKQSAQNNIARVLCFEEDESVSERPKLGSF